MTSKFFSIAAAILVAAVAAPSAYAVAYTDAQFKAELKKRIGKKTGNAAINSAAGFLKLALGDKKNASKVSNFTKYTTQALAPTKVVSTSLKASAALKIEQALFDGYFKSGPVKTTDSKFNAALVTALKFIPTPSRTSSVSKSAYDIINNFFTKKGIGSQSWSYYQTISVKVPITPVS